MGIHGLCLDQVGFVVGGYYQPNERLVSALGHCITSVDIDPRELDECLTAISCGDFCVTRCIPKKKPGKCPYEAWGRLHDLEEGTIRKC